jgi:hypothetical protein
MPIKSKQAQNTFTIAALVLSITGSGQFYASPALALSSTISSPVNTASCPTQPPKLENGGFEDFSNPESDPTVASGSHNGNAYYGFWHGYANGPNQILFLKPSAVPGSGETANFVTGWRSTSQLIELQRQVSTFSSRTNNLGQIFSVSPSLSGVATLATTQAGGSYFDTYGPQAAEGASWAELNAIENSALFQDVEVPSSARLFWSIKHRGRTDTNEQMKVKIGPVSNNVATTLEQTSIQKFAPTDSNKFAGFPSYGNTSTSTTTITSKLSDGWNRFEGTYPPDNSQGAPALRTMRLEFEAVTGGLGSTAFGNLLDDIQFTAFVACPVTQTLRVGETATLDVTGINPSSNVERVSYGIRQSLSAFGNTTASSSLFTTSGDSVSFSPSSAGTFTADYEVQMNFAGQTYSTASRITYVVSAGPVSPAVLNPAPSSSQSASSSSVQPSKTPSVLANTGQDSQFLASLVFVLLALGSISIAVSRKGNKS